MDYKLVPFDPNVATSDPANSASIALSAVIAAHAAEGWEYVELANHSTVVPESSGCFGIGASAPYPKTVSVVVFRR